MTEMKKHYSTMLKYIMPAAVFFCTFNALENYEMQRAYEPISVYTRIHNKKLQDNKKLLAESKSALESLAKNAFASAADYIALRKKYDVRLDAQVKAYDAFMRTPDAYFEIQRDSSAAHATVNSAGINLLGAAIPLIVAGGIVATISQSRQKYNL